METLIILGGIAVALVIALKVFARSAKSTGKKGEKLDYSVKWPYRKKKTLLTVHEQPMYFALRDALPEYLVFAQVQLSRIIEVKRGSDFISWYARISRMSVDFAICNKSTEVIAVIELDDASHQKEERQQVDARKDKACQDAGIPIIRWLAPPNREEIRKTIEDLQKK